MRFRFFLPVLLALSPIAAASTWTVGPGGPPTYHYSSINAAIGNGSTVNGDTVLVYPTTPYYAESISFLGKAITVTSASGAVATIIDASLLQPPSLPTPVPVVAFVNGETSTSILDGFTIRGGESNGGGIKCVGTSPQIINNIITGNGQLFPGNGGGIYCQGGAPSIVGNSISANEAVNGGGIYCDDSSPLISGNTAINGNTASAHGGGIYITGTGFVQVDTNTINGNVAETQSGGGIAVEGTTSTYIFSNTISGNRADFPLDPDGGGGIALLGNGTLNTSLEDNLIRSNDSNGDGGGLHCNDSSPFVFYNRFLRNEAESFGGGIHLDDFSDAEIYSNEISNNYAHVNGGGICVRGESDPEIYTSVISENIAQTRGGGIYVEDSSPNITYNTIELNGLPGSSYSAPVDGGGICVVATNPSGLAVTPGIIGNDINDNYATTQGGGISLSYSSAIVASNTLDSNGIAVDPTTSNLVYTGSGGGIAASGEAPEIDANLFIRNEAESAGAGVYLSTLSSTSTFTNNVVVRNWLHVGTGGGVYCFVSSSGYSFINNTIAQNYNTDDLTTPTTYGDGVALYTGGSTPLNVYNCIIRGNTTHSAIRTGGVYADISYSNVGPTVSPMEWNSVTANITSVPGFVSIPGNDYHLQSLSPCINAGDNSVSGLPALDFDGQNRINPAGAAIVDMGAYEYY